MNDVARVCTRVEPRETAGRAGIVSIVVVAAWTMLFAACGGGNGGGSAVRFEGNVVDVIVPGEQQARMPARPDGREVF